MIKSILMVKMREEKNDYILILYSDKNIMKRGKRQILYDLILNTNGCFR